MGKGFFITGSDTGVGKTVIAAAIVRKLMRRGVRVGAMKPFETGCIRRGGLLLPADALFLKEAAAMDEPLDLIAPECLELPLAPLVAARREGRSVDFRRIVDAFTEMSERYECMVVEGAGGMLAPIANREYGAEDTEVGSHGSGVRSRDGASTTYFMADLIRDLQLPAVIVTRPALGTINHTLMSVREALRGGITVAGVVINYCSPAQNTIAERTNPEILRELCPVPILGIVPHLLGVSLQMIEEIAAPCIDLTL